MAAFPGVVIRRRYRHQKTSHLAVPESAKLGAGDFIFPGPVDVDLERDLHTGNNVLLRTQFPYEKIVNHIARMQQQQNVPAHRNSETGAHDVVFTSGVGGIDTEWITSRIADEAILGLTET